MRALISSFFLLLIVIPSGMYLYQVSVGNNNVLKEDASAIISPTKMPNSTIPKPTSGADLSYIMIVANENVELKLLDPSGDIVGESFIQQPLKDPVSGKLSGPSVRELLFADPKSGKYRLTTNSSGNSTIEVYLYDRGAEVNIKRLETMGKNTYLINFDKESSKNSTVSPL